MARSAATSSPGGVPGTRGSARPVRVVLPVLFGRALDLRGGPHVAVGLPGRRRSPAGIPLSLVSSVYSVWWWMRTLGSATSGPSPSLATSTRCAGRRHRSRRGRRRGVDRRAGDSSWRLSERINRAAATARPSVVGRPPTSRMLSTPSSSIQPGRWVVVTATTLTGKVRAPGSMSSRGPLRRAEARRSCSRFDRTCPKFRESPSREREFDSSIFGPPPANRWRGDICKRGPPEPSLAGRASRKFLGRFWASRRVVLDAGRRHNASGCAPRTRRHKG